MSEPNPEFLELMTDALDERLSSEDEVRFRALLEESAANRREWESFREMRGLLLGVGTEKAPRDLAPRIRLQIQGLEARPEPSRWSHLAAMGWGRSAAVAAVLVMVTIIVVKERPWKDAEAPVGQRARETAESARDLAGSDAEGAASAKAPSAPRLSGSRDSVRDGESLEVDGKSAPRAAASDSEPGPPVREFRVGAPTTGRKPEEIDKQADRARSTAGLQKRNKPLPSRVQPTQGASGQRKGKKAPAVSRTFRITHKDPVRTFGFGVLDDTKLSMADAGGTSGGNLFLDGMITLQSALESGDERAQNSAGLESLARDLSNAEYLGRAVFDIGSKTEKKGRRRGGRSRGRARVAELKSDTGPRRRESPRSRAPQRGGKPEEQRRSRQPEPTKKGPGTVRGAPTEAFSGRVPRGGGRPPKSARPKKPGTPGGQPSPAATPQGAPAAPRPGAVVAPRPMRQPAKSKSPAPAPAPVNGLSAPMTSERVLYTISGPQATGQVRRLLDPSRTKGKSALRELTLRDLAPRAGEKAKDKRQSSTRPAYAIFEVTLAASAADRLVGALESLPNLRMRVAGRSLLGASRPTPPVPSESALATPRARLRTMVVVVLDE